MIHRLTGLTRLADGAHCQRANVCMRQASQLPFSLQDALAPWIIVLLEIFPHLSRLQLDHNADASASRAGSHQVSRTLTPRGQTGSGYAAGSMQQLHHGVASASAISTASGSMLQHSMHGKCEVPHTSIKKE